MAQYEIREDHSDTYRPFQVIDLSDGQPVPDHFVSNDAAQEWIDSLARASANFDAFSRAFYGDPESEHLQSIETTPEPEPVLPDEIIIEVEDAQEVGAVIEYKGQQWEVTNSEYISPADVVEMEDGFDIFLSSGWHSWLKKVKINV